MSGDMYVLVYCMEYRGGSRGSQLGVYSSVEKAVKAWKKFVDSDEDLKEEVKGLGGDYDVLGPKILKFTVDAVPEEYWPRVEVKNIKWT